MKKSFYGYFILSLLLTAGAFRSLAQVSVNGPTCVIPALTYQYVISGQWDSASTMQVCLTGGKIAGSTNTCTTNGKPVSYVRVIWDSVSSGAIQLSTSSGNANLAVTVSRSLQGGLIQDSSGAQTIVYDSTPGNIRCSASQGGSCSPQIQYQWQQSADRVHWTDISGATTQDYTGQGTLQGTQYYRRRVTDQSSNQTAYSDIARIVVNQPIPTTSN